LTTNTTTNKNRHATIKTSIAASPKSPNPVSLPAFSNKQSISVPIVCTSIASAKSLLSGVSFRNGLLLPYTFTIVTVTIVETTICS